MFHKKNLLSVFIIVCLLLITNCVFAKIKPQEKYMGEATVKVGDIWMINTPADFSATNCEIIERYKSNGVRFTQTGDTTVTAYYWDLTNPRKSILYSQVKKFHVIPSEEYGESIQVPIPQNNYVQEILSLFNEKRVKAGLEPLILDEELCHKAQIRAQSLRISLYAEYQYIYGGEKIPILDDKSYKFINEYPGLQFGRSMLPISAEDIISPFQKDTIDETNSLDPVKMLMDKKARYFGVAFTMDTNQNYYWSFLFADKKK